MTKENLKEGSKVYKALQIYEVMDVCATHSPKQQQNEIQAQTEVTNVSCYLSVIELLISPQRKTLNDYL